MPEKDDCTELQMELRDRWHSEMHGGPGGTRRYRWRPEVQMARGGADGAWLWRALGTELQAAQSEGTLR